MIIPKGTVVTIDGKVYRTLEAQVAWNKEELESLDIEALEALPDQFTELQENVSALGDSVADVTEDVGELKSDMTDAQTDISGLKTRMTTAETNIGTNAGEITQLQFDMGQAQGDITSLGNSKLNKPTNTGEVGDVIVKTAGGTEYQSVAPFNPNGTYPNVTAGKAISAKSLENVSEDSGSTQTTPFFFQATATANGTAETPTAPVFNLKSIRGNTIVYNQLVDGVSTTYATISGHVYWFKHDPLVTLVTSTGTDINVPTPQSDKLVDLTRWFNGSIPQAILDDPTVFPTNYYDDDLTYSAGELKNCSCTELKTVRFNLYDTSFLDTATGITKSGDYWFGSCGNMISAINANKWVNKARHAGGICVTFNGYGATANTYFRFVFHYTDGTTSNAGQVIGTTDEHLSVTSNTSKTVDYIDATYGTGANIFIKDICINLSWDGERDGEYAPYTSHTYPLVWSGKSAGTAYDEKFPDGTEITRIGSYTFTGSETWDWVESWGAFRCYAITNAKGTPISTSQANAIMNEYLPTNNYATIARRIPYTFILNPIAHSPNTFAVIDPNYSESDIDAFKTHIAGKTIYYELATPTTSEGTPYTSEIEGDDYGTMSFDSIVPAGNEFFYPADYSLLIDDLGNYTSYDVTVLAKKSDLIPAPVGDGTYTLKAVKSGDTVTYTWEAVS